MGSVLPGFENETLDQISGLNEDLKRVKTAFRKASVPEKLIQCVGTKALRSGRKLTGKFQSNRSSRWILCEEDPQYGTEIDCKIINIMLLGSILEFSNPPPVSGGIRRWLEKDYFKRELIPNTYKDCLLRDHIFDYDTFVGETQTPNHGHSDFHIGHYDPTLSPKHKPNNVFWRTYRSNLIQGNMTIPETINYLKRIIDA